MNFYNKSIKVSEMEEVTDVTQRGNQGPEDFMWDFPPFGKKSVKHFRQIVPVQIHHFYITDEIKDVDPYLNMINTLKTSEPHDTVFIYLNTPGGSLMTTVQIISAIKQSAANVITCMEGQVASAGTMIFLAGHKHIIGANSNFMAHNYSAGHVGKGYELKTKQKFDESYITKLVRNVYTGFLTEEEISAILEDRDVWLDADEVAQRLKHKLLPLPGDELQNDAANILASLFGVADTANEVEVAVTNDAAKAPKPKPKPKRKKAPVKGKTTESTGLK